MSDNETGYSQLRSANKLTPKKSLRYRSADEMTPEKSESYTFKKDVSKSVIIRLYISSCTYIIIRARMLIN